MYSVSECLSAPGLSLLVPIPRTQGSALTSATVSAAIEEEYVSGYIIDEDSDSSAAAATSLSMPTVQLFPTNGKCECSLDVRIQHDGTLKAAAPRGQGSSHVRSFQFSADRVMLRIIAPESATPALNWALGFDALRVLESRRPSTSIGRGAGSLDWLVSVDAEEEEDMRERIECGIQGEAFRRDRCQSLLSIERVPCGVEGGVGRTLALPESCRVAAAPSRTTPPLFPSQHLPSQVTTHAYAYKCHETYTSSQHCARRPQS